MVSIPDFAEDEELKTSAKCNAEAVPHMAAHSASKRQGPLE